MKEKVTDFIKNYKYPLIGAVCALIAIIIILVVSLSGGKDVSEEALEWGEGVTEGIPEFGQAYVSQAGNEGYAAFYYENVTVVQVEEYTALIEKECNIQFSSDKYPRTAKYGEKAIVIHYNVTEMKMSVTVTVNSIESGDQQ